ncbi:OLC1v1001943C1 [Oldenlandia corymbosa var. corymbosa]|uniref:OLC1v1001943C1 n=1 Tax=Oldenlandia corymbosa var. corymbosa TaxID=529605 RepID=A0AAV1D6L6_OLDCO|nr:OLC1v1001943C1 [Oldenlandia corymbosa var. corymbosa]
MSDYCTEEESVESIRRSLSEISEEETVRFSVDLVAAARHNLGFLRLVAESDWLHHKSTIVESIRRYDQLWMPLISDLTMGSSTSSPPPRLLPPLDVEWVWFCHTLNPVSYREYCESKFSKLIGKAAIFDEENEEYAVNRCREIWEQRYPSEPFENEYDFDSETPYVVNEDILNQVTKQRHLHSKFSEPFRSEVVYLMAARQRYKGFLYSMSRVAGRCCHLVPTSDILLMLLTHQSYPTAYAVDCTEFEGHIKKVSCSWDTVKEDAIAETKDLWEEVFDQPYEKAGCLAIGRSNVKLPLYWDVTDIDVNTKYKSLMPRFLLEFCVSVKLKGKPSVMTKRDISNKILRLRFARCHKELRLDKPVVEFKSGSWHKAWHLYCEFGTKGATLELREIGGLLFKRDTRLSTLTFLWNDLLRTRTLSFSKEIDDLIRADASITPPVQAPYLLKCVSDRVTDDSGTMISDLILKMNQYRPQEGRWLSRTVLDHAGRECFVIRMRMGGGIWRRGGETPSAVRWEDRITEIREGSWSYVASSIGKAPEKVVGTATPQEPTEGWQASWNLSTGDELLVSRGSTTSTSGFYFEVKDKNSTDTKVRLLKGRKMQYQDKKFSLEDHQLEDQEDDDDDDDGFVTLVRFSEENPTGKATALLNWKLLMVEVLPEEDVVLGLLLCISILRSISEIEKEDVGNLLIRRRIREPKIGEKDWGSVMLHPSSYSEVMPSCISSPFLQPWYWNARAVMGSQMMMNNVSRQPPGVNLNYSPAEGGDKLYKSGIFARKM